MSGDSFDYGGIARYSYSELDETALCTVTSAVRQLQHDGHADAAVELVRLVTEKLQLSLSADGARAARLAADFEAFDKVLVGLDRAAAGDDYPQDALATIAKWRTYKTENT